MTSTPAKSAQLLQQALPFFNDNDHILDLACGLGRNGCYLANLGYQLTYLDRNEASLNAIKQQDSNGKLLLVDLETTPPYALLQHAYDAIIVFRYLHRALMPSIINALKPGGIIVYETFTHHQADIGRPKNPDFLLNDGELMEHFARFDSFYTFEGFDEQQEAFVAQFIGRKRNSVKHDQA